MKKKWAVWLLVTAMAVTSVPMTVPAAEFQPEDVCEEYMGEDDFVQEAPEVTEETLEEESLSGEAVGADGENLAGSTFLAEENKEPEAVTEEETGMLTESGTCGGSLTWTLNEAGVLRISGRGAMESYSFSSLFGSIRNEIKEIIIEEGVTTVGNRAFTGTSVETLTLPDTLTRVGEYAFNGCNNLKSVYIPQNVVRIERDAFSFCDALSEVQFDKRVSGLVIGQSAFDYSRELTDLEIPGGVTDLGVYAFRNCSKLISLTLHEGLTSIASHAFTACRSLQKVNIPSTVTSIGSMAFYECKGLQEVSFSEGIREMDDFVFYKCDSLTKVTLPGSLEVIPGGTFASCGALQSIVIPEGVKSLGAFSNASSNAGVFFECTSLRTVSLPSTLTKIMGATFDSCENLQDITLPSNLETIGNAAFLKCKSLRKLSLPGKVNFIGSEAFRGCSALTEFVIPEGVKKLNNGAFRDCVNLLSIRIPASVERIEGSVFEGCVSLSEIYFEGDAPYMYGTTCQDVIAKAYYPANNATWTANKRVDYGGSLTWIGYHPALRAPALASISNTSKGIKISWNKVSGAAGYVIYRRSGNGSYVYVGRTTNDSYNNNKTTAGTAYTYTVRAYRGDFNTANQHRYDTEYWSEWDEGGLSIVRLEAGSISSLTNAAASISVKWNKVAGAKGYNIYRKAGSGSYVVIAKVGSGTLSYSDKNVKNGTTYTYAVRAYNGTSQGSYVAKPLYRLSRTLLFGVAKNGSGKATIKWNKNVRVTGYQISYKVDGVTKYKTVKGSGSLSTTLTGLSAGKTYTVRIRGYRSVSGKNYYAAWSTAKTVNV